MTNSEWFEKNKISFAEAMEIFNKQKSKKGGTKSFDKFLASEPFNHKFKVGDLVVLQLTKEVRENGWEHNIVFEIRHIDVLPWNDGNYSVKFLTPDLNTKTGDIVHVIGSFRVFTADFIDRNCIKY